MNKQLRNTKFKKIILTIVIVVFVLVYIFWSYILKPSRLWHETYWNHRLALGSAISQYQSEFGRLPKSLEDMVSTGILPQRSNIFSCPILHGTSGGKVISYTECEYTIIFDPNKIVISIPKEVFNKRGYKVDEKRVKWEFPG